MRSASARHEQTLRALNLAGLALQQVHTPEEAYAAASKEMNQLGYRTCILVLSHDRGHLQLERAALDVETQAAVEKLTGLSADSYLIPIGLLTGYEAIAERRQTIFVTNLVSLIAKALPVPALPLAKKIAKLLAVKQGILAPLLKRGQVRGILIASADELSEAEVPVVTAFAAQISAALERTWLLEREQQRLAELGKLNNALRLLTSQLRESRDGPAIARLLCEAVCKTLGWRQAIVSLRRSEAMASRPLDWVGYPQEVVAEQWAALLSPPGDALWMKEEFQVGHSYYVPDLAVLLDPGEKQQAISTGEAKHPPDLLVVPLEAGERILGVLSPARYEGKPLPTRQQIEHLELFAAQAAFAIESVRLSKAMRMWANAMQQSENAVVIADVEGTIVSINPAFEELSGYRQEEVVGLSTRILSSGLMSSDISTDMWSMSLDNGKWHGEVVNRRKDGSVYDADLTVAPILDEEDRIIGLIGHYKNINQTRKLDRLRTKFVSNISHELRTPLTNIKLYQRYLQEGRRPDLQERFFDILDRETDRLMQTIEGLLDLSRLESGAMPLDSEPLDINDLVSQVLAGYYEQARERRISLIFEPADNLPGIIAGRHQISQVITNLLNNALNYTLSDGSVHVTTGSSGAAILLSIRDTGHGMTAEETEHIFERFYRGEAARKLGIPGTGLGLPIVKQTLELHGGTIEVESQIGEGTTVRVTLPAAKADVIPTKILLVEDDPDLQFLVRHQLEKEGYKVILAGTGEGALDQLAKEAPDLMVLDLGLPKMDGFEVLEHMQTGEYGPAPPVLVITGADSVVSSRALTLGATEYLSKPYSPQVFLDVVCRLLQNRELS